MKKQKLEESYNSIYEKYKQQSAKEKSNRRQTTQFHPVSSSFKGFQIFTNKRPLLSAQFSIFPKDHHKDFI